MPTRLALIQYLRYGCGESRKSAGEGAAQAAAAEAGGVRADPADLRRHLQHGSRTVARLLRIQRNAGARVRGGSGGGGRSRVDRAARGGRDQPGVREVRMVPAKVGKALPAPHSAGDRETSGRVS